MGQPLSPDNLFLLSNRSISSSFKKNIYLVVLGLFKKYIIIFWLCWVFAAHRLSPVVVSGGYSLVVVKCWFLIDMSSLVEKHRL